MIKARRTQTIGKQPTGGGLDRSEPKFGPKMLALPTEKHRNFVIALFTVRAGHGAAARAARAAGFGTETSSPASIATISSRLMHDDRVIEAMREYGEQFLKAAGPNALRALEKLILTPSHKGHERAVAAVVDRLYPVETVQTLNVRHDATPAFRATADVLARITEVAARLGIDSHSLPPLIDLKAEKST
jgi:hypothetical protein